MDGGVSDLHDTRLLCLVLAVYLTPDECLAIAAADACADKGDICNVPVPKPTQLHERSRLGFHR